MSQLKLMFDVDGTITRWNDNRDYENFEPIKPMVDTINRFYDEGHHITLFTARGMTSVGEDKIDELILPRLIENLKRIGLKYHEIITKKPAYDLLVDDRAIDPNTFMKLACSVWKTPKSIEYVLEKVDKNNKEYLNDN